jgi:membrane associated rhomboid family serine protease
VFKRFQPAGPQTDHPVPILTMGVITICILVFLGIHFQGATDEMVQRWGYVPSQKIWAGDFRGLVTSVFVHVDPLHLIFNLYWLWIIGAAVELEIGPGRWLALFLTSAIVSSGAELATGTQGIGMSGVGYALFGFAWASRWQIDRFRQVISQQTALMMILWLVGCWIGTIAGFMQIANEAHLGGLIFGTLVGEVFVRKRHRVWLGTALVVFSVASLVPAFWAPWTGQWAGMEAMRAHRRRDYQTAERLYRVALRRGEDPAWAWKNLVLVYAKEGDEQKLKDALDHLEKVDSSAASEFQRKLGGEPSSPGSE